MIGPYRIGRLLGSGGTGKVYAAIDTRCGEEVALKILSGSALADAEQRRRFAHEAKTIGLLNHPNIVKLRETGSASSEEGDVHYIAMELVEGRTLDETIPAGGMAALPAARLAVAILRALETAHAAGVVHRDLKPRNIIVTNSGVPKLVDFGLAKRLGPLSTAPDGETLSIHESITANGTIVGTVAYMAPEQAEAKQTDARADVFSFGSILYEMLTATRAFQGETPMATLSSVIKSDPPPLPAPVPEPLRYLVERCLRKDPARRYQSIGDVRVSMEDLLTGLECPKPAPEAPVSRRSLIIGGLGGVAAGAISGVVGTRAWRRELPDPRRLTFRRGDVMSARFGPAGEVIYSAAWGADPPRTFVAQPGNREARPLDLPAGWLLSVSKKSELAILLGREQTGTLARVPLGGGTPREILENVSWAEWGPDGESMAIVRRVGQAYRLEYPVGTVLLEAAGRKPELPRFSPDGSKIAILVYDNEAGDFSLNLVGLDKKRQVAATGFRVISGLAWTPAGSRVLVAGARPGESPAIFRVDPGAEERVAYRMPGWPHLMDCGPNGDLLVAAVTSRLGIAARTPFASHELDLAWLDGSRVNDLSSDGTMMLFSEISSGEGRNTAIYLRKTDGSPAVRVGYGNRATLSPDARFVACLRHAAEGSQILVLPAGTGEERVVPAGGMRYEAVECHPDGKRILFSAGRRSYLRDIGGGNPTAVTPEGTVISRISPDGTRAVAMAKGKLQLWPLGGGAPVECCAVRATEQACRWSNDGRYLFLAALENGGMSVEISRIETASGRREPWRHLEPMEPGAVFWGSTAVSGDGAFHAASFRQDLSELYLIKGVS